jgi:hypothetical protein
MNKLIEKAKAFWASAKALWASLPHQAQAAIILFGTAAGTTLAKELQARIMGTLSFSVSSLEHDLGMAITAGFIAVRAFYCLPNRDTPPTPPTPSQQ